MKLTQVLLSMKRWAAYYLLVLQVYGAPEVFRFDWGAAKDVLSSTGTDLLNGFCDVLTIGLAIL